MKPSQDLPFQYQYMMHEKDFTRRDFIRKNSLAGMGALALGALPGFTAHADTPAYQLSGIKSLAGMSLQKLYDRYENELFNRFLPSMEKLSVDNEYGGFICDAHLGTGKVISYNKRTWYQGRGIWVYSFLYNKLKRDPRYLEIAEKAVDFVSTLKRTEDKFFDTNYTREGNKMSDSGDIYGDLFVAEGLAEFSLAKGDPSYLKRAKGMIFYCLERYDRPDYVYDISYVPGRPRMEGPRNLGHWMIFLSLSTQILSHSYDEDFVKLANRCIDAIMTKHMNPEFKLLNEAVNHDFSLPANEYRNFAVIGHGIETLAFVMAEAVRRKDATLFRQSEAAFKRHVAVAADKLYGGHFEILYNANTYSWAPSKSAWCQQEVSIGALLSLEHTGYRWAEECFNEGDAYMMDKMLRPELPFWTFGGGRKVDVPNMTTIEHYHTPRYLMRNMLALKRIMGRKGKLSGLVS
jgi:N-acylglucosamine 2-epimerase